MGNKNRLVENRKLSQLIIIISYTLFSVILIGETILMDWEKWMIPLIAISVIACWIMHIFRKPSEKGRMWVYSILMMVTFFFYGIHPTSIFDMVAVAGCVIVIFSFVDEARLIYMIAVTYFITFIYDIIAALGRGYEPDALTVSRVFLHIVVILIFTRVSIIIINRRREEISGYDLIIKELEENNRRTEDFLTNVSHELRTPINAVTGITSVIIKKVHNEEIKEEIRSVRQAGNRLLEQVSAILDYTEIDTGKLVVSNEEYMITSIINDIITEKQLFSLSENTELIFDVDADIPSKLEGDGAKIKKVMKNVISNAVKFTHEGGVFVHVSALKKNYGINLCIEVEDTGIGIGDEELEKIKERFYQVNSGRARRAGGLGLGLSIVYGLVRAMGGFVKLDSKKGEGTRIHISIPQKVADPLPSVHIDNKDRICAVCFIRLEKYSSPRVREFYREMIKNTVQKFDIRLYNAYSRNDLEKLKNTYNITHLFVDREEYEDNTDYINSLDRDTRIVVICNDSFEAAAGSRVTLMRKPFHSLAVANILNSDPNDSETDEGDGRRMVCPGIRALVVDDEAMNLIVAEGIFRDYGMSVKTVFGGLDAIRLCEQEDFDIIFLDHMMPDMDGIETIKNLRTIERSKGKKFTVVALTANAVSGAREMFLKEGFDGFVPKPIEYSELERVLKRVLPESAIEYVSRDARSSEAEDTDSISGENDIIKKLKKSGIDTATGIKYCRNDRAFYLELLDNFVSEYDGKNKDLIKALDEGDLDSYHIRVHALKSTARMLGAAKLSDFAKNMEDAAKKKDAPYLQAHQEELLLMYEETAGSVADCIGRKAADLFDEDEDEDMKEIEDKDLMRALEEIKKSLDTYEVEKAEGLIKDLSAHSFRGRKVSDFVRQIGDGIRDFDMKAATDEAQKLLDEIKGGRPDE